MADQQGQLLQRRSHPGRLLLDLVVMDTHTPALLRALGMAAEHQGQQLVAEAHAEQLVAALVAPLQVGLERLDPWIGAKGIGLAAGDQVGVVLLIVGRIVTLHDVVHGELRSNRLAFEQALEHAAVALILLDQFGAKDIGFQNADTQ
ncbi:hypothetical protein D3C85_1426100 [compost metagenome]